MIIDSHAHIFEQISGTSGKGEVRPIGNGKIRLLDGEEIRIIPDGLGDREFTAETLIAQMDQAGIDRAVLLHGLRYGLQNEYVFESVRKYPQRLTGSGSFDPCIDQADTALDRLVNHFGFRILKFELSTGAGMTGVHPGLKIDGDEFERIYLTAEQKQVTIVFDIGSRGMKSFQVEELLRAAKRHPQVKFVLCHLMAPNGKQKELWRDDMRRLAGQENVWFDITALPWNVGGAYPWSSSLEYVLEARDIVGTSRMMWGSDVPTLLTMDSYARQYQYLMEGQKLRASELEELLCKTSQTVYSA